MAMSTLALRRCSCGEPMPNPFDTRCPACYRKPFLCCCLCGRPYLGRSVCRPCAVAWAGGGPIDLDDSADAEHEAALIAEDDAKRDAQYMDPDGVF